MTTEKALTAVESAINKSFEVFRKERKELLKALKDADNLLVKHVEGYELDNPTYWNIKEVLEKHTQ